MSCPSTLLRMGQQSDEVQWSQLMMLLFVVVNSYASLSEQLLKVDRGGLKLKNLTTSAENSRGRGVAVRGREKEMC